MSNIIISNSSTNPWDLQSYDTPESFKAFTEYYLNAPLPRSIRDSYNRYLLKEKGIGIKKARATPITPEFMQWANAWDGNNDRIPYSLNWAERAAAFEDEKMALFKNQITNMQLGVVEKEILDFNLMLEYWNILFEENANTFKQAREDAELLGETYDNTKETIKFDTLLEVRERISNLQRRAVGLHTKEQKEGSFGSSDKEKPFLVEWTEPKVLPVQSHSGEKVEEGTEEMNDE